MINVFGMQTYLEVKIPIRSTARWLVDLKSTLADIPIRWQNGYYHITLSFLSETAAIQDVISVIDKYMKSVEVSELSFDKLDVFTAKSAGMHIINLTVSDIPETFKAWVNGIRTELAEIGCVIESDFRLHVTLGRADASLSHIENIQALIHKVDMPSFKLPLTSYEYRVFRGKTIKTWDLS